MDNRTLNLNLKQAKQIYANADNPIKKLLENTFPELKPKEMINFLKTKWAFDKLGKNYERFVNNINKLEESLRSDLKDGVISDDECKDEILSLYRSSVLRVLEIVIEAKNEGWQPDWDDDDQCKWFPWFFLDSPGFRFGFVGYRYAATSAGCASRLYLSSRELAEYVGQNYLDLWKYYMTN